MVVHLKQMASKSVAAILLVVHLALFCFVSSNATVTFPKYAKKQPRTLKGDQPTQESSFIFANGNFIMRWTICNES